MRDRDYLDREVLNTLYDEFIEIATERLMSDPREKLSIDIHILDRTRYQPDHYAPVPYETRSYTEEEHEEVLRTLIANLNTASEALNRWSRGRFHIRTSGVTTATDKHLTDENRRLVKENETIGSDLHKLRQDQGAMIRKDEAVKRARKQRDDTEDAMRHFWRCKTRDCDKCAAFKKKHRLDDR